MSDHRLQELHRLLQKALEVELFTIPPYLTALYSIHESRNQEASQIIQGVVMEEMLHMALIANVMTSIGGTPRLSPRIVNKDPKNSCRLQVRTYPSQFPHVNLDLEVSLQRFCPSAIHTFMKIEEPEDPKEWPPHTGKGPFGSIGQFYEIVLHRIIALCSDLKEATVFSGNPEWQIRMEHYYGAGGNVVPVYDLTSAKDVIAQVAQQGEGRRVSNLTGDSERFGQPKEVAHYFRFEQILAGRYYERDDDVTLAPTGRDLTVDWKAVYPMQDNPDGKIERPTGIADLLKAFGQTYCEVLDGLHRGFNGEQCALAQTVPAMHRLRHQSTALMRVECSSGITSGPPFWYVELTDRGT